MNFRMVLKSLGIVLICEAILVLFSLITSLYYDDTNEVFAFLYTILMILLIGLPLISIKPVVKNMYARDGFAIVAFSWILVSFFGAMPYYLSGEIISFVDCFFEAISGFTTTGASIILNVERMPKSLLFWRSFTHWSGGMGVLVLTLAILPSVGARTFHIMKAESPGPNLRKLVPKIGQTAKILYGIYFIMTIILILLLVLAGMPFYDAVLHAFGTAGTGGFSNKSTSIGAYGNVYVDMILTVFMLIFGTNYALFYHVYKKNIKSMLKDDEFRFYISVVTVATILIAFNIYGNVFQTLLQSFRHAVFQVSSVITTTAFVTSDFATWPTFSKVILMLLMFTGACAGSTTGGVKCIRVLLLLKVIKREIMKIIHPRSIYQIKIRGVAVEEERVSSIMTFFFAYMFLLAVALVVVALDGYDFETTFSAVVACIGNTGFGFGGVGPMENFSSVSNISKIVLSMCMLLGRLEIYPILLLVVPSFWKRVNI